MKNINEIVASLNVARSNDCSKEKSEEFKSIIKELLPYGELEQKLGINLVILSKLYNETNVYAFDNHCQPTRNEISFISIREKTIRLYNGVCGREYPLKEYGRMFALTKEELL